MSIFVYVEGGAFMDALYYLRYVEAAVPPLVFLLSLWSLLESKYSARVT